MKSKVVAGLLACLILSGCAYIKNFRNKGKAETLANADKELASLINDRQDDCTLFLARLRTLRAKVLAELEKVK